MEQRILRWSVASLAALLWSGLAVAQQDQEAELEAADEQVDGDDEEAPPPELHVGGALRFNYFVKSWEGQEGNRDRLGDLAFDTFRLNVDASWNGLRLSGEYRFYPGYQMLHHGYVGYLFSDEVALDLGVTRVPFGILPYASHNWFFDLSYYVGLEDDYDLGLLASFPLGPLDAQLAFYKMDEGSYTGGSIDSARYSYDIVMTNPDELGYAGLTEERTDEETDQANLRVVLPLEHSPAASTELGLSGQVGRLYDNTTAEHGYHWAGAAHVNGTYGPINLMLEFAYYAIEPELPDGQDDRFVPMGAYDAPYKVASEGMLLLANLAYTVPVAWGPIQSLTFYNDFSALLKAESDFEDTLMNVTGVLIAAGPVYIYLDAAGGVNMPWLGPNYGAALAEGDPDAEWELRTNLNVGWYF